MTFYKKAFVHVTCLLILIFLEVPVRVLGYAQDDSVKYEISMEQPNTHYYHLHFEYKLQDTSQTAVFKMPVWTPGYYWIQDYPKNVTRFSPKDSKGRSLKWRKTTKNSWEIDCSGVKVLTVAYDVYAHDHSIADPFLDRYYGFISPTGLFMWPEGMLERPVRITVHPYKDWKQISTGLTAIPGRKFTFQASDFDQLYDSPMLIGNQKELKFSVEGVPHTLALLHPGNFDTAKLISDLQKIIGKATEMMGEIPYDHYTFLVMGEGRGGLEHMNSAAVFSNNKVYNANKEEQYSRWLGFLAHEYFHNFNVKRIRPVALGPFDYNRENYTHMLWVAEGVTVYYQYLLLNRVGLLGSQETLDRIRDNIRNYEWIPGRQFQSVRQASFNTWIQFFNRGPDSENRTISYYDKGCVLGLLMDFKIRHVTAGRKSLDDVMRTLYQRYYKDKNRGYTDREFRKTVEEVAGTSLDDIFRYASTTKSINYAKYLAYAGLAIDTTYKTTDNGYLGAKVIEKSGRLAVTGIVRDSPAWKGGLGSGDVILKINGEHATTTKWDNMCSSAKAGDKVTLLTILNGFKKEIELTFGAAKHKSFNITRVAHPTKEQQRVFSAWLK